MNIYIFFFPIIICISTKLKIYIYIYILLSNFTIDKPSIDKYRNSLLLTGNMIYRVRFLFSYNYRHKYKTEDTHSCVIILIGTELKASYSRVKTLPNDILLNQ